jgi:hypothetical protein
MNYRLSNLDLRIFPRKCRKSIISMLNVCISFKELSSEICIHTILYHNKYNRNFEFIFRFQSKKLINKNFQ